MQLSRLSITEMLALSQPYIDTEHPAHQALVKIPEVATLLPRLREAHEILLASQSADDLHVSQLKKEVALLEAEHDELAHGIHHFIQAMTLLAEEDVQTRWERLHEVLLPGSGKFASTSHKREAGNAALLEQILDGISAQDKGLLRAQFVGKRSLFEAIERWIAVGRLLGQKELERQSVPVAPSDSSLQESRNQWAKTVGAIASLLQMAELLDGLPAEIKQHVLAPLRSAADRRVIRRSLMSLDAIIPSAPAPAQDPKKPS